MTEEQDRRAASNGMTVREVYAILRERSVAIDQRFASQDKAVELALERSRSSSAIIWTVVATLINFALTIGSIVAALWHR